MGKRNSENFTPDLTAYRKAMLLHGITFDEIDALLKEYAELTADPKQVDCEFFYTSLPDDPSWVYAEFPNFEQVSYELTFWHYQNLLIWFSQKSDKEFCLAIPKDQSQPLFLSIMNRENQFGDSCIGIYADRDFCYTVPAESFEWGPVPTSPFNFAAFLQGRFQFDTRWIPKVSQCRWHSTKITLTFPR